MDESASNIFVARYSRKNLALRLFLFAGLTALFGWASVQLPTSSLIDFAARVLTTALFALFFFVTANRFLDRAPVLVLDDDGIVANVTWADVGRIRWTEITGARVERRRGLLYLVISVRDPTRFIERGNWLQRDSRKGSLRRFGSPVAIPAVFVDADVRQIASEIQRRAAPK